MPTQITALPTPPSRQDPANFSTRADAFLGALPAFGTEANALADEVNTNSSIAQSSAITASESALVASGAANYRGDYSAGTTYLLGQSVSYLGNRYIAKKTNLNLTPADGADWLLIKGADNVRKPVVIEPIGLVSAQPIVFSGSAFAPLYSADSRSYRQFQVALSTDVNFTSPIVDKQANSDALDITALVNKNTAYICRIRDVLVDTTSSEWSNSVAFTTDATLLDNAEDVDKLDKLLTIQQNYSATKTYSVGEVVIITKSDLRLLEYTSLQNNNLNNNPETSPTFWNLTFDNNTTTAGYFGEVLGSSCAVDKGEWLSTTTYSPGDMVVVKNIPIPKKQSDLTAYVSKTANTNKPPASNPSDWEQRNALPTGTSLAQTLGIGNTAPEVLINNDSGWLKFVHKGKIKYIAKKPFICTVSWDDIAKAEAVYGNRTVRIGSRLYRVSLLSGAEADPSSWTTSSTATDNKGAGSEWNELVYRVHNVVPTDGTTTYHGGKQVGSNWWNFTDADMTITSAAGNGSYTWCKETLSFNTTGRVGRGFDSLSYFYNATSSSASTVYGWRPCLTLISEPEADSSLYNAEATGVGPSVASLQYDPITDTGYYGEVTSAQFYTGTQISTATAVTSGTLQNDTEGWLKFYWHGQVLFIAKKTYRYSISWDNINSANAVYGVNLGSTGKKTITHSGSSTSYDVKLMKGATKDPSPASSPGRQWNELLYRVCTGTETGEIGANWATLNPSTDLGINTGNGSYSWTQEVYRPTTTSRVNRDGASLSGFGNAPSSDTTALTGWRPCLSYVRP